MPDEIEPALTPQEWEDVTRDRLHRGAMAEHLHSLSPDYFALMALANAALPDDDPRKITRKDVMALEDAASSLRAEYGSGDEDSYDLDRLAAKLAALLPPNK